MIPVSCWCYDTCMKHPGLLHKSLQVRIIFLNITFLSPNSVKTFRENSIVWIMFYNLKIHAFITCKFLQCCQNGKWFDLDTSYHFRCFLFWAAKCIISMSTVKEFHFSFHFWELCFRSQSRPKQCFFTCFLCSIQEMIASMWIKWATLYTSTSN